VAEWGLTKGSHNDLGIPLNFTLINFDSDLPHGQVGSVYFEWETYLKDYTIDAYSFPNLEITGMEADTGDSEGKIAPGYIIAMDFGGEVILTIAGIAMGLPGGQIIGIIGAFVGLSVIGGAAVVNYVQGQEVSRYDQTIQENHHWQLKSTRNMGVDPYGDKSVSDLVFLGLDPTAGRACGLTKVVLKGTLQATYWIYTYDGRFPWHFPIGNIEISLCVPWFIWA